MLSWSRSEEKKARAASLGTPSQDERVLELQRRMEERAAERRRQTAQLRVPPPRVVRPQLRVSWEGSEGNLLGLRGRGLLGHEEADVCAPRCGTQCLLLNHPLAGSSGGAALAGAGPESRTQAAGNAGGRPHLPAYPPPGGCLSSSAALRKHRAWPLTCVPTPALFLNPSQNAHPLPNSSLLLGSCPRKDKVQWRTRNAKQLLLLWTAAGYPRFYMLNLASPSLCPARLFVGLGAPLSRSQ